METDADLVQQIASSTQASSTTILYLLSFLSSTQQATRPASTGRSTTCTWRTFTSSLRGFGMTSWVFPSFHKDRGTHTKVFHVYCVWPGLGILRVFLCHEINKDFHEFGLFCDYSEEQGFIKLRMCWFNHTALPLPKTSHPHLQKFGLCKV